MLRIAVVDPKFGTAGSGGARESLLTILSTLSKKVDISVDAFQTAPVDDPPNTDYNCTIQQKDVYSIPKLRWTDQVFRRKQFIKYLRENFTSEYDLTITQNHLSPAGVRISQEYSIPSLLFMRSMPSTGSEKYSPQHGHYKNLTSTDIGGKIQYPFLWKNFTEYKQAARSATVSIANSKYTASKMQRLFDVKPAVIYPPIKLNQYRVDYDSAGYITMVNPREKYKGTDIFLDIADRLQDEQFLMVGTIKSSALRDRVEDTPNVTHWTWCDNMQEAYAKTKLVVVPSRWEEPFGRVPAEAMVSGIPCVVSNRGGLPEVVGSTGTVVDDVESIDAWISAINSTLLDHHPKQQQKRVRKFSAEEQVRRLLKIIDTIKQDNY